MERLKFIRKTADEKNITAYEIAKGTGLSAVGIQHIISGRTKAPTRKSLQLIHDYLKGILDDPSGGGATSPSQEVLNVIVPLLERIEAALVEYGLQMDEMDEKLERNYKIFLKNKPAD